MEFIYLCSYSNYIEANIALAMLEEEGIRCHTEDENSSTILGYHTGVRLMVFKDQAARAAALIRKAETVYYQQLECPRCRHTGFHAEEITENDEPALRKIPFGRLIAFLARLLTKDGTRSTRKIHVCDNCQKVAEDLS